MNYAETGRHTGFAFRRMLIAVAVCGSACLPAASIPGTLGPARSLNYLALHSDLRATEFSLIDAEARLKEAEARLEQAEQLFQNSITLYSRQAISLESAKIARLRYDLGLTRVRQWKQTIASLEAQVSSDVFLLKTTAGDAVTLDKAYAEYQKSWKAQCDKAKVDVSASEAQLDFDQFELSMTQRLQSSEAASREDFWAKQAKVAESKAELEAAKQWDAQCTKLVPTLAFLKQLDTDSGH